MSDTPRALTGILRDGQGQPLPNRSITWFRVPRKVQGQGGSAIVDELFTTTTDGSGAITGTSLVPGKYQARIRLADVDRFFEVSIAEGSGAVQIQDAIDTAAPPITPPLVIEAQTARDEAVAAASAASDSEDAAAASALQAGRWGIYADTAAGLAATESGDFFSVYDETPPERILYYENVEGVASLVASIEAVQDFDSDEVVNASGVDGATVSAALDWLSANRAAATLRDGLLGRWAGTGGAAETPGPLQRIFLGPGFRFGVSSGEDSLLPDFASQAEAEAGENFSRPMSPQRTKQAIDAQVPSQDDAVWVDGVSSEESRLSPAQLRAALNAAGLAPVAAARAWVNFDATTTPPTIRAGLNVAEITVPSANVFRIVFDEELEDGDYAVTGMAVSTGANLARLTQPNGGAQTAAHVDVAVNIGDSTLIASPRVMVSIFR